MRVVVIDYGLCNLLSVYNALKFIGVDSMVSHNSHDLERADAVILPGVGAFEDGMKGLREKGFIKPIHDYVMTGRPLMGICLGMQLLMDKSYEFGVHEGLGLIAGDVVPVENKTPSGEPLKIPHIGWNGIFKGIVDWDKTVLQSLKDGVEMYFVHSFRVNPVDARYVLAWTNYGGNRLCSVVAKDRVYGCQFHPEKSSNFGLEILKNFISLK